MLIFPILSILITYIDFCLYIKFGEKIKNQSRLSALLYDISIHTLIVLVSNEFLSLFRGIHFFSFSLLWIITTLIAVFLLIIMIKKKNIKSYNIIACFTIPKAAFTPIIIFLILICCTAFFLSIRTTPYNWDSMTYHLTKLTHWTQNGSVAHYVCHDLSQISTPPLAEFINLHVYILSGQNDYFLNLLQTFSYILSVFLVYKISRITGCCKLFSSLAALVFATTPIAFGEALTTQVDMYSGFWILVFAYSVLHFMNKSQKLTWDIENIFQLLLMGASAGFCYLSKPSTIIAIPVFAVWLLLVCFCRRDKLATVIKSVITVIITGLVIILPELTRNFITFQSIASPDTSTEFLVPSLDIRYLLENLIQNIGFNLPTKYLDINPIIERMIFKAAYILYAGAQIPDKQLSFQLHDPSYGHDSATNPTIIWLMIFSILFVFIIYLYRRITKNKISGQNLSYGYIISSMISFLLFCTFLQWYTFITRYEIGYLALLAPAIMLLFQYIFNQNEKLIYAFAGIIIFICSITFISLIQYHKDYAQPAKTEEIRMMQYFSVRGLYWPYRKVSDQIIEKQYKNIGFLCGVDSYEYPFWKMLENTIDRFEHVCVTNKTERYDKADFLPDCIISVDVETSNVIEYHNISYELITEEEGVKLFEHK